MLAVVVVVVVVLAVVVVVVIVLAVVVVVVVVLAVVVAAILPVVVVVVGPVGCLQGFCRTPSQHMSNINHRCIYKHFHTFPEPFE